MSHYHYSFQKDNIQKLNVRLLSLSHSKDGVDWTSVFHSHVFTELFYVVNGEGRFLFRDKTHTVRAGDLIIVPPHVEHTEQSSKNEDTKLEYYVVGLDGIVFQREDSPSAVQLICNFSNRALITDLFEQMRYEIRTHGYGSDHICLNLLEILILRIIRSQKVIPVPLPSVNMPKECAQIKDFLDANYSEHITLDTLTELTNMNKYYLAHSFSKYTGQSPIQYLNQRRMEAACMLLRDSDYSISAISSTIGFSSQSYFTQTFRKHYGMTPVQYRHLHKTP